MRERRAAAQGQAAAVDAGMPIAEPVAMNAPALHVPSAWPAPQS